MDREIWIRTDNNNVEESKSVLLALIEEDESLAGEIGVKIYAHDSRAIHRLSHIYDLSECAVNVLKERFGDDNVKLTGESEELKKKIQDDEDRAFMEAAGSIWNRLDLLAKRGFGIKNGLMVLLLMQLEELNLALGIEGDITMALNAIADCVSARNQFCVAADVTGEIVTDHC